MMTPTLLGITENMRDMFAHHSQEWADAVKLVDDVLALLGSCGWESWQVDGINAQAEQFELWRGERDRWDVYSDPDMAKRFPLVITGLALSQSLPNVSIGLARSALICMHGFFAQARNAFRTTVEECLYAYMIIGEPEHGRQYLADGPGLWKASQKLRKFWAKRIKDKDTCDKVPQFGVTFERIYQQHIHSGSHGGFEQSAHRTRGSSQAFVDVDSPMLGAYPVSFTAAVLELVDHLMPMHPSVDRKVWRAGYAAFHKAKGPILNAMRSPV